MNRVIAAGNHLVAAILTSPAHGVMSSAVCLLEVTGERTGRRFRFPVQYAVMGEPSDGAPVERIAVWPGHPETKTWWHNLRRPAAVTVWVRGMRRTGVGAVLEPDAEGHAAARAAYAARFPKVTLPATDPIVVLTLDPAPGSAPGIA